MLDALTVTCAVGLALSALLAATTKPVSEWIGPQPGGHPFFSALRTFVSMLWFAFGQIFFGLLAVVFGIGLVALLK